MKIWSYISWDCRTDIVSVYGWEVLGLSLAKMLYGVNAFEISDIQEDETGGRANKATGKEQCYICSKIPERSFWNAQYYKPVSV